MVEHFDNSLTHYANIIKSLLNKDIGQVAGSGAEVGLARALWHLFSARLVKGRGLVINIYL
ncbi:glycerate kinase I [Clostridium putrefaciens]|uniref:Glycerate kinase I n=1 Tax=Clostridium putrefaciens TaxID=99675 RepID=A0A381K7L2_9CLOT|nr:glycerate kinase I [Clostridium putrefaciens]